MATIEVTGLRKSYGSREVLHGLDFTVEQGEVFALLGPNGAGKTTTVEILEGYRRRDGGAAQVLGCDPGETGTGFRARIGIVLQSSAVYPTLTVGETLELFAGYYPSPRDPPEVVALVGLEDKRDARVRTLSGGQLRRLDLGLALVGDPELIFLDEPTTGFDPEARRRAWDTVLGLRDLGKTVLLTTHYLEEAEALCGRIAMLKAGRVVALDTTRNLLTRVAGLTVRLVAERVPASWQSRVTSHDGRIFILGLERYADLESLLAALRLEDIAIDELALQETDLEQVFLQIMGAGRPR